MEAVRFSFNDFDLVVYAFDFPCLDWIITVIDDTISMAFKHSGKSG